MTPQKISILTPSYGQLDWLRSCVASVADQSPGASVLSIEHTIQDGGTPGIVEFLGTLAPKLGLEIREPIANEALRADRDGYTLVLYTEPDAGMYDALNKGMARMSGELWAWINSDEQYLPGTLQYVARWFSQHPAADILCGDALLTDREGRALSYRRIIEPRLMHTRLVHLSSLSCASFYRRSIVERVGGFDTRWRAIGDAEWMARMLQAKMRINVCGKLLATFAFTGQNTSESPAAKKEAQRWSQMPGAPSEWLKIPVILHHRFRKWLAGSYASRSVEYSIYSKNGDERFNHSIRRIGWGWPAAAKTKVPGLDSGHGTSVSRAIRVLGTELFATTYRGLAEYLIGKTRRSGGAIVVDFANTQIVTMKKHDPSFAFLAECVDITVPDGMPLVWAMNTRGAGLKDRVYGPTFTREFLAACLPGTTHYLVGGSEECGLRFCRRMKQLNPSLEFVGGYHGPCSTDGILEEDERVLAEIREKKPDFIWVGLGTPKQYGWIHRIKPLIDQGVLLAVGFAFDVNAGMKPDAPLWMQGMGMTWLYRMSTEPERLAGRYFKWNTLFLWYWSFESLAPYSRKLKLSLRKMLLSAADFFASDIRDCVTGDSLGRGLVLGWGGHPWVIGHEGLPPLIPIFLPQQRLTYWKQSIGFTTHQRPDFPRMNSSLHIPERGGKVMNIVLSHLGGDSYKSILERWSSVCSQESLWIAFGGTRQSFESIDYSRKVFVEDQSLRKMDNQREKQSYTGIFQAMAFVVEKERPEFIYFCEYDHLPLVHDLNRKQVDEMIRENADVMGHWLYRVDGSSHYHMLYHQSEPGFIPFWKSLSHREDPGVILSMFGSGSMWTRDAFLALAKRTQEIPCYLEIYLPSLAHHLGYRVRGWNESNHLLSNLPSPLISVDEGLRRGAWTVHPVK